jgi:hypothetical protein
MRKTMAQTEPARWQSFLVCRADWIVACGACAERVCGERNNQWVEYIGSKGDQWWEIGVDVWEANLEAQDGGGIRTFG